MRKTPVLKLDRSPLIFSLAQVRFAPVLKMKDYVPDLQEVIRKEGFPKFQAQQVQQMILGPQVQIEQSFRWVFSSPDSHEAVVLTNDFLVYETSQYDVFETFTAKLKKFLALIERTVGVSLTERIGLRYVDLLRPSEGRQAADFLRPGLRGLSAESIGAHSLLEHFYIQAKSPYGDLLIRAMGTNDGRFMPPDLASTELTFDISAAPGQNLVILDFDHTAPGGKFDPDAIIATMWNLHETTERAFRAAVTEEAIDYWKTK